MPPLKKIPFHLNIRSVMVVKYCVPLQGFREGRFQVLVATDVAARGLDIPEVDLVIQCEPPKVMHHNIIQKMYMYMYV